MEESFQRRFRGFQYEHHTRLSGRRVGVSDKKHKKKRVEFYRLSKTCFFTSLSPWKRCEVFTFFCGRFFLLFSLRNRNDCEMRQMTRSMSLSLRSVDPLKYRQSNDDRKLRWILFAYLVETVWHLFLPHLFFFSRLLGWNNDSSPSFESEGEIKKFKFPPLVITSHHWQTNVFMASHIKLHRCSKASKSSYGERSEVKDRTDN